MRNPTVPANRVRPKSVLAPLKVLPMAGSWLVQVGATHFATPCMQSEEAGLDREVRNRQAGSDLFTPAARGRIGGRKGATTRSAPYFEDAQAAQKNLFLAVPMKRRASVAP